MRQRMGVRKVKQLREKTGLPVVAVLVRGGTDHRRDLCLEDGSVVHLYRDGELERSDIRHRCSPDVPDQQARDVGGKGQ